MEENCKRCGKSVAAYCVDCAADIANNEAAVKAKMLEIILNMQCNQPHNIVREEIKQALMEFISKYAKEGIVKREIAELVEQSENEKG